MNVGQIYCLHIMENLQLNLASLSTTQTPQTLLIEWVIFTHITFAGLNDFAVFTILALTSL